MDRFTVNYLRAILSAHLTCLAFLTAIVVVMGSGSLVLPSLMFLVGVFSFIFVDCLRWFTLHRSLATLGMIVGTIASLADYAWGVLYADSPTHQLYAVASLLIYPQVVLLLQRKNVRIFEQLSIFLLLEVIVAALVNDSLLFGILLIPIVMIWVASLFLLARYAAIIRLDPSLEIPTPRLIELVVDYIKKSRASTLPTKLPGASVEVFPLKTMMLPRFRMIAAHTLPISMATSIIACLYFGLLPRTEGAKYSVPLGASVQTGFAKSLTLGSMGKMLQDKTPAFRMKLTHARTGRAYILSEPPYIRGLVYGQYGLSYYDPSRETSWEPINNETEMGDLPKFERLTQAYLVNRDAVRAHFEQMSDNGVLFGVAPYYMVGKSSYNTMFFPFDWRLVKTEERSTFGAKKLTYDLGSTGFSNGRNVPLIPFDNGDFTPDREDRSYEAATEPLLQSLGPPQLRGPNPFAEQHRLLRQLGRLRVMTSSGSEQSDEQNFRALIALKDRILVAAGVRRDEPVRAAQTLEKFFVESGEYTYSLNSNVQHDLTIDPIEDFIVNQKQGHCQYFASALAMMLRHCGIPTRLVGGFHPHEFNQLGKYFVVRNSDAHAWVEAFFTADEIKSSGVEPSFPAPRGCWLTLDPTPAGDGDDSALRDPPDQAIDYAQQLWTEYVIEAHQITSEDGLYARFITMSAEAYNGAMKNAFQLYVEIRNGTLMHRFAGGTWFSWPVALLAILLASSVALAAKMASFLSGLVPRLARNLGFGLGHQSVSQQFFARCLKLLVPLGFHRTASQTPRELTQSAASFLLDKRNIAGAEIALATLTSEYYRSRFSDRTTLTPDELRTVNHALESLESMLARRTSSR